MHIPMYRFKEFPLSRQPVFDKFISIFLWIPKKKPISVYPISTFFASQTRAITHNVYSQFNTNRTPESPYSSRKVYNSDMKTNNLMWNPNQGMALPNTPHPWPPSPLFNISTQV